MKPLTKSLPFWIGIATGIILSLVIGIVDYNMKYDGLCMDCDNDFGFPFRIYQSGSLIHASQIIWIGLFGNIFIFGLLSVCVGLLFHSLRFFKVL
jgi:hypothetical protein